jgi:hypothetical protein
MYIGFLFYLTDYPGEDDIAVEEIVMDGEQLIGGDGFVDPSQLCSVQITGSSAGPLYSAIDSFLPAFILGDLKCRQIMKN